MDIIDARGLSCPEPVILIRKAMQSGEKKYCMLTDNHASKENVTRYAEHEGYSVTISEKDGEYMLEMAKQ